MKNKLYFLLSALAFTLVLASCSDDNTSTSPTNNDILPNTIGNYWIMENYELDSLSRKIDSTYTLDTTKVTNTKMLNGKTATEFKSNSPEAIPFYLAKENNKVYMDASYFNMMLGFLEGFASEASIDPTKFYFDEKWLLIADPTQTEWQIASKSFSDIPFQYDKYSGKLEGTNVIKGKKGTAINITINGKTYSAQEYIMENNLNMSLKAGFLSLGTVSIKATLHFYFANGVGLVKQTAENTVISMKIPLINKNEDSIFPGSITNCIGFNVK